MRSIWLAFVVVVVIICSIGVDLEGVDAAHGIVLHPECYLHDTVQSTWIIHYHYDFVPDVAGSVYVEEPMVTDPASTFSDNLLLATPGLLASVGTTYWWEGHVVGNPILIMDDASITGGSSITWDLFNVSLVIDSTYVTTNFIVCDGFIDHIPPEVEDPSRRRRRRAVDERSVEERALTIPVSVSDGTLREYQEQIYIDCVGAFLADVTKSGAYSTAVTEARARIDGWNSTAHPTGRYADGILYHEDGSFSVKILQLGPDDYVLPFKVDLIPTVGPDDPYRHLINLEPIVQQTLRYIQLYDGISSPRILYDPVRDFYDVWGTFETALPTT